MSHPFLSRLSEDEFRWEVSECKRRIEEELQVPADYFAYPNGREQDFGLSNKDIDSGGGISRGRDDDLGCQQQLDRPI